MNTDDKLSMITESTFDSQMRRTMERLEERLHRGDRTVEIDIHELLHILGRSVALYQDRARMEATLFGSFHSYRDHFNRSVNSRIMMPADLEKEDR